MECISYKSYLKLVKPVFPEFTIEETMNRIHSKWEMSGPVPLPKFEVKCPVCSEKKPLLKGALFHTRRKVSSNPFRCDVKFKCIECSFVWAHGLVVPREMAVQHDFNRTIHFRELQRKINDHIKSLKNRK